MGILHTSYCIDSLGLVELCEIVSLVCSRFGHSSVRHNGKYARKRMKILASTFGPGTASLGLFIIWNS